MAKAMKRKAWALACGIGMGFGLAAAPASAGDAPRIEYRPLSIGALQEFGQLKKGLYKIGPGNVGEVWTNDWTDHFGAFLTKEAVVDDRLFLSAGLGGVFEFRKPEFVNPGFYGSQRKAFFIGPTKAVAEYRFGDPARPYLTLGSGMFPYKYNPDAVDLGEYLYRSGAYPGYTVTGGYVVVNSAAANLQGLKSSLTLGDFNADLLFTTETGLAPLYDWSLGAIFGYKMAGGLVDLGAGVNFKRLLPVKPSRTSPRVVENGYFSKDGRDYTTNSNFYAYQIQFYQARNNRADSAKAAALQILLDTVTAVLDPDRAAGKPEIHYYSNSGFLAMARLSVDFKKLFASSRLGPQDLKLYSEAAVLGVKDYPVFYASITERIPVMVGFNLPCFGMLDLFSLQVERYASPWLNNTSQIANDAIPLPIFPIATDSIASGRNWNDLAGKDDFKWSVLLRKKLGNYVTLSGQVANDHLRTVSSRYFYGPQFDHNEVTVSKDHWYWMTQLSWGI